MAYHDLVIYPRLPQGVQFLEVSPGDARFLEQKVDDRIPGGTRVTLTDFGTSTILLCTTDLALCDRIQRHVRSIQPVAARMAIRQAEIQYASVVEVHERLKADGHLINNEEDLKKRAKRGIEGKPTDANDLVAQSDVFIKTRPQGTRGRGLRHRLGRGPAGGPAAAPPDVRLLATGHGRVAQGRGGELQRPQDRIRGGRDQAVPQAAGARHGGLLPSRGLLLYPAPIAHLEGLGQGAPRLPLRREPGPVRLVRR